MIVEKRIEIRDRDIDSYHHVNNAVYLSYLSEARIELHRRLFELDEDAESVVLARVEIDFLREVKRADQYVTVRCRVSHVGTSSFRTTEEIVLPDGDVAARAESVTVAWHGPGGAGSRPLTEQERAALEGALAAAE